MLLPLTRTPVSPITLSLRSLKLLDITDVASRHVIRLCRVSKVTRQKELKGHYSFGHIPCSVICNLPFVLVAALCTNTETRTRVDRAGYSRHLFNSTMPS